VKSFVINRHGSLVLPSNCFPELDFSVLQTLEQFSAVVRRDFDAKAPTGTNLRERSETQAYNSRYELLRDLGLHLFWVNRFSITMYEKRPMAWRHVPKKRDDVFMPIVTPWQDGERKTAAGSVRRVNRRQVGTPVRQTGRLPHAAHRRLPRTAAGV
jgi:3-oxoacyl-[acyl-carrier-protein] synthase-3